MWGEPAISKNKRACYNCCVNYFKEEKLLHVARRWTLFSLYLTGFEYLKTPKVFSKVDLWLPFKARLCWVVYIFEA